MGSNPQLLQKVVSLCRKRGFFFQALPSKDEMKGERYVLGPLGAELKRNLINEWLVESMMWNMQKIYLFELFCIISMMDLFFLLQVVFCHHI